jgi:pyruvate kinase
MPDTLSGPGGGRFSAHPFQIVATLGPASWDSPRPLIDAGATALRINTSHASVEEVRNAMDRLRRVPSPIRVVLDLQGAKMRLGQFADRPIRARDLVIFSLAPASSAGVPLPHPEFFAQVAPGDTLQIDDGRLRFSVTSRDAFGVRATALGDGTLRARKGVNLIEHPVRLSGLTEKDRLLCSLAAESPLAACAVSFMADGQEASWVRSVAPGCPVIGKLERREALESLEAIDGTVDELWVCRGDLGVQVGLPELARWMARLEPLRLRHPVFVAGQVLEHLTAHTAPTRSEVCHLYDLWARGYAGVVLSDETAIGDDPVGAVRTASALIEGYRA